MSLATTAAAQTGHFLFPLGVGGVVPGELGAGLHSPDTDETKIRRQQTITTVVVIIIIICSSPAGEEGDDGETGVVGVGEDVLDEQVWLAAVL